MTGYVVVERKYYTFRPAVWHDVALFREIEDARKWIKQFSHINADYRIDEVDIAPGWRWVNRLGGGIVWIKEG